MRLVQEGVDVRQRLHERLSDAVEAPVVVADVSRPRAVSARTPPTPLDRPSSVESSLEARASRSVSWRRSSTSSPSNSRLIDLVRGIGPDRLPVSRTSLIPLPGGRPRGGPATPPGCEDIVTSATSAFTVAAKSGWSCPSKASEASANCNHAR